MDEKIIIKYGFMMIFILSFAIVGVATIIQNGTFIFIGLATIFITLIFGHWI